MQLMSFVALQVTSGGPSVSTGPPQSHEQSVLYALGASHRHARGAQRMVGGWHADHSAAFPRLRRYISAVLTHGML